MDSGQPAGRSPATVAAGFLGFSIVCWGISYWPIEVAGPHAPGLVFTALRSAPTVIALLVAVRLLGRRLPDRAVWPWAAASGVVTVCLYLWALTEGTTRAGPGNAAVLGNTSPFFVLLLSRFLLGQRASRLAIGGLIVGFAGVLVMVLPQAGGDVETGNLVLGLTLALLGAAAWGVGTVIVGKLVERDPKLDLVGLTAFQYLVGAPILLAAAFAIHGTDGTDWGSPSLWAPAIWSALAPSGVATITFFAALKYVSPTNASSWLFLIPVVAVLVEVARGRTPEALVLVGMVIAIGGVAIVNTAPQLMSNRLVRSALRRSGTESAAG